MPFAALIVAAVVIVAILIAVAWSTSRRQRREGLQRSARLREQFGPEYDRTVAELGSTRSAEKELTARQELALLEHAIAQLPAGCRTVLLLRKVELLSHREIADRLGIAVSTVEKQHARALRLLRAALPNETGCGPVAAAPASNPEVQS